MDKQQRLQEFLRRMTSAPAASDHQSALALLSDTLNAVEDQYSGVPYDPESWETDGRMYPPQLDSSREVKGFPGVIRYRSRSHNTYISDAGAIEIQTPNPAHQGSVLFSKLGANGQGVWDK